MGLGNRESSNLTYLSTYGGKITQEWRKEPKAEWIPAGKELKTRKITKGKNEGKTVWYVEFDYVAGILADVSTKGGDYGTQLIIKIKDVDETYQLSLNIDSAQAQHFLLKMNNLDLNEEVSLEPWSMEPDAWFKLTGKTAKSTKSGMTIKQNDQKIENFYTKEDPKGMPELVIKEVRGETKVDSTERDIFLDDRLKEFIAELKKARESEYAAPRTGGKVTEAPAPSGGSDEEFDDLPF